MCAGEINHAHLDQARLRDRSEARDGLDYGGRVVDVPFGNFEEKRLIIDGGGGHGKRAERQSYWFE